MNFFYCLSLSDTSDDSCMLFRDLTGIFTANDENIPLEIIEKKISAGSIQFHNGVTQTGKIWEWIKSGLESKTNQSTETRNVQIALHGLDSMLCSWIIKGAYPISCDPDLVTGEVRLNSLKLAYSTLVRAYP